METLSTVSMNLYHIDIALIYRLPNTSWTFFFFFIIDHYNISKNFKIKVYCNWISLPVQLLHSY